MSGYEDRLIKKSAKRSKRTLTFDTRVDHLKMENKNKISLFHQDKFNLREDMSGVIRSRCLTPGA